jgi:hypothetical protein
MSIIDTGATAARIGGAAEQSSRLGADRSRNASATDSSDNFAKLLESLSATTLPTTAAAAQTPAAASAHHHHGGHRKLEGTNPGSPNGTSVPPLLPSK